MAFRPIKYPTPGAYLPHQHAPRIKAKVRFRLQNRTHRVLDYEHMWKKTFLTRVAAAFRGWLIKRVFRRKSLRGKRDKPRMVAGQPQNYLAYHSAPGKPPYAHKPKSAFLRNAIQFAVNVAAGFSRVGTYYPFCRFWGYKHEHGAKKFGRMRADYPKRPFVAPGAKQYIAHGMPQIIADINKKMAAKAAKI